MSRIIWPVTYLLSGICILLLLWGGVETGHRLLNELWNIGHIVAFFIWTLLVAKIPWCRKLPFAVFMTLLLVFSAVVGSSIEALQLLRGSNFSVTDLLNDLTGSWLALTIIYFSRNQPFRLPLLAMLSGAVVLSLFAFRSIAVTLYDEIQMYRNFPILVDFKTSLQRQRIWAEAMEIVSAPDNESIKVLKLDFDTAEYSGFALQHFVANWSEYQFLSLSLYRQQSTSLTINCRINDRQHDLDGYAYQDRFHSEYRIVQGWNVINIPLEEIQNAPTNRLMDLSDISNLGCFVVRQPMKQTLYLHTISLY